uniref:Retrotransposon gag domain-containing protein n=1 Tax=Tanacetum cinerariifolium TaxID=118510 RepID=A0A6L2KHR4_TANCI|nr:hypothetical protein [Tanacetum cinerariifolium]
MEQYMSKTQGDYESGITRPTINQDTQFELKWKFLKELRDNTFSGSAHEDANEHIEKVLEIVDLFRIPKITQDQIMLRAFLVSLTGAASRWLRNQPSGSIMTWEVLKTKFLNKYCPHVRTAKKMEEINNFQQEPDESLFRAWERFKELLMKCPQHYLTDMQEVILFYNGLDVPTRQILDLKGDIPSKPDADAKVAIQEMVEFSHKWHNGTSSRSRSTETSDGLATIQAQLNNLGREMKKVYEKVYAAQVRCKSCKGPHYTKDCSQKEKVKTLEEAYYTQFGAPYQPRGQYRAAGPGFYQRNNGNSSYPDRRPSLEESLTKFMTESAKRHEENSNIIKEIRASTDTAIRNQEASVSVMPFSTYTNLGLGILSHTRLTIKLADRTIKQPKGIAKNMVVRIGKFIFLIDFIILDNIPEDDDVPLILGRPFLSTAHSKIDVFKRKITLRVGEEKLVFKSIKPATSIIKRVFMFKNLDSKTELIEEGDESFNPMYVKDKDEGRIHAGTLVDIPVFVRNFSIITGTIRRLLGFGIQRIDPSRMLYNLSGRMEN